MHWVIQVPALPLLFPKLVFDGLSVHGLCALVRDCCAPAIGSVTSPVLDEVAFPVPLGL
jgi:hypothetical protein